jgi:FdhD protein
MNTAQKQFIYVQYKSGDWAQNKAEIIVESSVSLTINGENWLSFMCTPVDLEPLAIGFLFNEGIIESLDDVSSTRVCQNNENVDVWLHHSVKNPKEWRRTSGCTGGMTSVVTNKDQRINSERLANNGHVLTASDINLLLDQLFKTQTIYKRTGGVHTSALCDGLELLCTTEDIGRHNTLDKIAGWSLLNNIHPKRSTLITTGRISSEMLQKSARLGASIVISRTSPSSLSIQMAEKWGITLIGYARRSQFRIYSHAHRILLDEKAHLIN